MPAARWHRSNEGGRLFTHGGGPAVSLALICQAVAADIVVPVLRVLGVPVIIVPVLPVIPIPSLVVSIVAFSQVLPVIGLRVPSVPILKFGGKKELQYL